MTFNALKENPAVKVYIERADDSLKALGFTEHSYAHVGNVATAASYILKTLNFTEHEIEMVKIAAYLQIPYLLWVTFAAYLNFAIWFLNR